MKACDLVNSSIKLLSLPETYLKLNELLENPQTASSDIAECVSLDPALSAQLLRIANSSLYNFSHQIDTVSRAITVIGMIGVRDLVLASSTVKMFSVLENNIIDIDSFWRHCISTAVYARQVAKKCKVLHTEPYFVAGILHHVGKLLIATKIPEMARNVIMQPHEKNISISHIEKNIVGFNHADVGGELMRKWQIPDHICDAVEFHHAPQMAQHSPLSAAIVHIASIVAGEACSLSEQLSLDQSIDPCAWSITGLQSEDISDVIDSAQEQCVAAIPLFLSKAA